MKRKNTKKWAMALAVFLAALMILPFIVSLFTASAVSNADVEAEKKKREALEVQKKQAQADIAKTREEKGSMLTLKGQLDTQIELTEEIIDSTLELLDGLNRDIDWKELQLEAAQRDEQDAFALYCQRVRAMTEQPKAEYLGVLLSSDSFSDMLSRMDVITDILRFDDQVRGKLASAREVVENDKAALEDDRAELEVERERLEALYQELDEQVSEVNGMIADLQLVENELIKVLNEVEKQKQESQRKIEAMMAELARKNVVYVGDPYLWPMPGYAMGSGDASKFGSRIHPITKKFSNHTGIDIPAATGTKIQAANSGTVVLVDSTGAYGKHIVIDHGGGQATMYAHMSKILVSKNQKVAKGEVIGLVGSTGYSTGPHLHFEMWRNGTPYNPLNKFSRVS